MNKFFTKIATLSVGLAMAIGVGVAAGSNRDVTSVSATVGSDVTIGSGTYTSAYETGFEDCTASTTYNSTQTYTSGTDANVKKGWSVYYGTVSTSSKITGSKSMHMRWYSSAKTNYPHAETTSAVSNVKAFKFNYAVGNTKVHFKVQYGTNGSSWTDISTVSPSDTSATEYSHEFTTAISSFYFRVLVCLGTAPTSGNFTFRIDDIVFGSPKAVACTVTLDKNGGSGGTDSVSATKGSAMPALASAPTKTGYAFAGYYDDASAGTQYYTANRASARNWDKDGTTATLYAHWTANQYNINYYDQGGSDFSGEHESGYPTKHTYGTETTLKGATKGGYNFDGWFTTSACTGSAVTSLGTTSYTDAISLYAKWTATGNIYSITTTVTNGTYSGDTQITDNGGVASVTIAPTGDYKLPTSVSVSGADHTYNSSTGIISLSNASGNVTISAAMVALTEYSITVNEDNGSHTGASTIKESRTASLTFEPDSGWGQPEDVTVTGASYTWTRSSGVLALSNPTGAVTVTYAAVGNELDSISISTNSGSYTLGDNFVMPTVTAKYTVNADADVTSSASYSGYDPYTTGSQPVTISYTEGGITKTQSYTATVGAASVTTTTTWELTDLADLTSSDEFVIARTSSTTVALPSNGGAAKPTVSSVTISNDKITSTVTDSILWNVTGNASDGYVFNPKGDSTKWLYLLDDANEGVRIGNGNSAANKHFTLEQGYLYSTETTSPRMIGVYNNADWRCYKLTSGGEPGSNIAGQTFGFFKKVETQTGSADLIRITATYKGGDKYVGDSISTSDFAVKKQLNTGNDLIDVASGYTISANTLTVESNSITVSLTEGKITKTAVVVVPATPRAVSLVSVELVQGENVVKEYVDWSGAEWDFTDLSIRRTWSDASTELFNLADLVESEDASVSPAKPAVGVSSFTVSYEYLSVSITNASVTGISVVADYVESVSWGDKSLSHFKAFSGEQLTSTTVSGWTVKATYAGAGETNALSFGTGANQFTIRIGDSKAVNSLPYTWTTADDNQFVYVVVGGVAKGDSTYAKTNICATINAIDHDEESTGEQTITLDLVGASYTKEGTSGTGSDTEVTISGFTITSDKGYAASESMRVYDGGSFTITSSYEMTNVSVTTTGGKNGLSGGSASGTSYEETADGQARVTTVTITFNGTVTTTTHYANDMNHFDAQKTVVEFAKFMNTTMNGENVCSGTFAGLESAWETVADKYDELFGASTTLNETELAWAKNMLKYATAAWGSDAENACVEKAMKTYEFCIAKHGVDPFMFESDGTTPLRSISSTPSISMLVSKNSSAVITIVIISAVSLAAIGGYFLFRKKKEDK